MLPVYIGIYIFMLAIVWGFFLIARHHSYKFSLGAGTTKTVEVDTKQKTTQNYY
jgi:hypothetical protein